MIDMKYLKVNIETSRSGTPYFQAPIATAVSQAQEVIKI